SVSAFEQDWRALGREAPDSAAHVGSKHRETDPDAWPGRGSLRVTTPLHLACEFEGFKSREGHGHRDLRSNLRAQPGGDEHTAGLRIFQTSVEVRLAVRRQHRLEAVAGELLDGARQLWG